MFYQIFLSPQVKQCAIITYKHKLAHQLPNKLTLRKYQESMKPHRIIAQRPVPPPKENRHQHQQKSPQNRNQPPPPARKPKPAPNTSRTTAGHTTKCKGSYTQQPQPPATIMGKRFQTNSCLHVKQGTTGKVKLLFFRSFLLHKKKISFWEENSALSYNSIKF